MLGLRGTSSSNNSFASMPAPASSGHTNGHTNGHSNSNDGAAKIYTMGNGSKSTINSDIHSPVSQNGVVRGSFGHQDSFRRRNLTDSNKITVLRQTVTTTRTRFIGDLSHVDEHYIDSMSVESFLEYIELQRLTHMPRQGGRWDKVLKWAEFFALQVSGYGKAVGSFLPDSKNAAKLIWAACRFLIELGPSNSQALEPTFAEFYKFGLTLSFFLQHHELLSFNSHIRGEVSNAFNDLLVLVSDVSLYYHSRIAIASKAVVIDFNMVFRGRIDAFYQRKDLIVESMWECRLGEDSVNIRVLREWLGVRDKVVRTVLGNRKTANSLRDEFTCEWFQRPLLDFSRSSDDVLNITAPSGFGKSVLAGWIVERLQRPLGKKTHETLFLTLASEIPSQCTSLAIAKQLALQLLDIEIGDVEFFDSLVRAYELSITGSHDNASLEIGIWDALDIALRKIEAENLMIIVDGLDKDRYGTKITAQVSDKIGSLASKHHSIQAIFLSRDSVPLVKVKARSFQITPDHTHHDLQHITEHSLRGFEYFDKLSEHEQEAIAEKLAHAAKGNFIWVQLVARNLKQETTSDAFAKAVKSAKEFPKSVHDLIRTLVSSTTSKFAKSETLLLLQWLLVAERPLTVAELKGLLQVDLPKKALIDFKGDITEYINSSLGNLLKVQNGIVRFRHGAFREHLVNMQTKGEVFSNIPVAQADFTKRILLYCKLRLTHSCKVAFEHPEISEIDNLFLKNGLLEYATRNWTTHFEKSVLYKTAGPLGLPEDLKLVFPNSVLFVMVEWSCWGSQYSSFNLVRVYDLALRVREEIFTPNNESVLQSLIACGQIYRKQSNVTEAGNCFYRASRIGQHILKTHSSVTISCTTSFLEITESITSTTRNELVTRKEELLQYVITACKHTYGKTSDIVIRYTKTLAELYVSIHEESKAETTWRELREIMIVRYGKGSDEETTVSGLLNITLKPGQKQEEIVEYEKNIFETTTEMDIWDVRRITITLKLAEAYESRGEILKAEEIFITLWSHLIDHCHRVHHRHVEIDVHISMIDIALEYVRFLRRCHRHEEAAGILICIWTEYEEYDFESEIIFLRLKTVGELMRSISLLSIAVSVFKKCWSWFKSHGKTEHVSSCQILISETINEIVTTTAITKTETSTSASTTVTETIIKEVFESTVSKSTVTIETISICQSLVSFYVKTEQWSEAIRTSRRSLELIWRTVISSGGIIALPREFASEAIEIAISLAICHQKLHHFHEAESIYLRVYRACFNSCHIDDERMTRVYTVLTNFYQENGNWKKVIEIHQEILVSYRKQLGASHASTIKLLYTLGELCGEHGYGHSHEYYEEINLVLNKESKVCHHDALKAVQVICQYYYEQGHWKRSKLTCELLWETYVHHHDKCKIDIGFFEVLYARYIYVLEHHFHASYDEIRRVTLQYQKTCATVFGISASITVRALIELAQISMRDEKYYHEAIEYYEEVIKIVKTTTTTTTTTVVSSTAISQVKQSLTKAYIHVCSQGSTSTTTIEKAILALNERFEHLKVTYGCSHSETLTVLRELVIMYWKQKTKESHARMVQILLETTVEILSVEKHSRTLYEAAKTVGGIYLKCDLADEGRKLLRELHNQVISKSTQSLKIDRSVGKSSYIFLVTLEQVIHGSVTISYSKAMTDLLTETILYESYSHCIKSEKDVEVVISSCARLYVFLKITNRREQLRVIQDEAYKIFTKKWGTVIQCSKEISFIFFIGLLQELGSLNRYIQIGNAACKSANAEVRELLSNGQVEDAYKVAQCAFQFIEHQRAYHSLHNVGYGFKLSGYMANRGLQKPIDKIDQELKQKMLTLSRKIIAEVLKACKESEINFVRLKPGELNDLVGLLGEQQNYTDLEWLLTSLWSHRDVQKSWKPYIISIGQRLVQARFLGGHRKEAISLCETICYNLRRVWGSLDPKTLEMSELLSQVYTAAGHHREAMRVHEDILRLVVEGDDGDDRTLDTMEPEKTAHHIRKLKQTYLNLKGWDKSDYVYKDLVNELLAMPEYKNHESFKDIQSTDNWSLKDRVEPKAEIARPSDWGFIDAENLTEAGDAVEENPHKVSKNSRQGYRRVTSNWGLNVVYDHIMGRSDEHQNGNGHLSSEAPEDALVSVM